MSDTEFEKLKEKRQRQIEALYRKKQQRYKAKAHRWQAVLKKNSDNVNALENLMQLECRLSRPKKALSYADKALNIFPLSTEALRWKGLAYLMMDKFKEAEQTLKEAIVINPYEKELYKTLSDIYKSMGHQKKRHSILRQAIKVFPDDGECAEWLICCWLSHARTRIL